LLALIDVPPRTRICTPPPGSPLFVTICTPLTRPCTSWFGFGHDALVGFIGVDLRH
jgi:hypothetical protein